MDKIPLEIIKDMANATFLHDTFMQNTLKTPEFTISVLNPHNSKFKPVSLSNKNRIFVKSCFIVNKILLGHNPNIDLISMSHNSHQLRENSFRCFTYFAHPANPHCHCWVV